MIANDQEVKTTQERILYFQNILAQLRITTTNEEFSLVSVSCIAEIQRMQKEILDYLTQHVTETLQAA